MTKVMFVVQRYGAEVVGGAEFLCRAIAEKLVAELGWQVTVYTTQAKDYVRWKNEIPKPEEVINDVQVRRFPVLFQRSLLLFGLVNRKLTPLILRLADAGGCLGRLGYLLERLWLILQGPYCPSLIKALETDVPAYDKVFFFTYLYYPTVFGAQALAGRNFALIPTAHNEPPLYFQHMRELFLSSNRILVNIAPEKMLIESKLGMELISIQYAGVGVDVPAGHDQTFESIPDKPYILYLGRVCKAKGLNLLIDSFRLYIEQNPDSQLSLVLVGSKDAEFEVPHSDRIKYLGFVSEPDKFALIAKSLCVANPSQFESLSLIAVEAMMCLKPLLLNRHSEILAHYCNVTETSFPFANEMTFASSLQEIESRNWQTSENQELLLRTRDWAKAHYSWEKVLRVYQESPGLTASP